MLLTERRADRVVLYNISWQQFENLLADLGGCVIINVTVPIFSTLISAGELNPQTLFKN